MNTPRNNPKLHTLYHSRYQSRYHARSQGFTLVEVMVALIVVAVALSTLLFQVSTQTDQSTYLKEKTIAHWVAQNQLNIMRLERQQKKRLFRGSKSGQTPMANHNWHWQLLSETTAIDGLYRYTISVGHLEQSPLVSRVAFLHE